MVRIKELQHSLPDYLMAIYFATSFIGIAYGHASGYTMFVCSILIFASVAMRGRGKIRIHIGAFHVLSILFAMFCLLSSLWATKMSLSLQMTSAIFKILGTLYLIYVYYQDQPTSHLLWAMMIGGYAFCLIALHDQGISAYLQAIVLGTRVYDQEYINANTMGMLMASTLVINFYFVLYEKEIKWWSLLAIPAFICMFGAGSKKGFMLLVGGFGLLLVLRNLNNKKFLKSMAKIAILLVVFIMLVAYLIQLPTFSFVYERFEGVINYLSGRGKVDFSTWERARMGELGMETFRRNPILGVGINNSELYNLRATYFHNNYIELLACTGIIGWALYYSMYIYIFWNFWKYRKFRTGETDCCLTILILHVMLEFAYVSYCNKETWFYFMLGFAQVHRLKQAARETKRLKEVNVYERNASQMHPAVQGASLQDGCALK